MTHNTEEKTGCTPTNQLIDGVLHAIVSVERFVVIARAAVETVTFMFT